MALVRAEPSPEGRILGFLDRAEEALQIAIDGLDDFESGDPKTLSAGLRNVAIYGRSVTFILQNLSGKVDGFNEWYSTECEKLSRDPLCRYFVGLRNSIEKQGQLAVGLSLLPRPPLTRRPLDASAIGPPPFPGAKYSLDFNGAKWFGTAPSGRYVEIPADIPFSWGIPTRVFDDTSDERVPDEWVGRPIAEACEVYLAKLEDVCTRCRELFAPLRVPYPVASRLTETEFFRWWYWDGRTATRRLTKTRMTREAAGLRYPGAEPELQSRQVRYTPEH